MNYRNYTTTIQKVSEIGLGTWQLGDDFCWKSVSEKEATTIVEKAIDLGINFFDTAPNYGLGTSEERLGRILKNHERDSFVINTKFGHNHLGKTDYSSKTIRNSLESSLKRLQMECVDSLIIHNPPLHFLDGNKNDHYEILERLIEEGKIKAYGASLDTFEEMKLLMETTNATVIEAFFNILHQDAKLAFQLAEKKEVAIIAKIPLDSGWLTGKYDAKSVFTDIRNRWSKHDIETRARLVNRVKEILQQEDNLAQKAISFCLAYKTVSTVIPGALSISQLESNVKSTLYPIYETELIKLEEFYNNEVANLQLPW
ncbi:oxidoreductase [Polaribacter gangjinensis]|uniref:Oxidoreductase n=2 Tax=Polaribacter gangjinensis TaxID=574710 RepID=A0A2S7WER1_9FLAO|nr:oxidoreductase [Polaribacter gangjinensis]